MSNEPPLHIFSSVTQSCPVLCDPWTEHTRLPCPSPTPGACSNSCPLSWWCRPTISYSVVPFSSCLQSFPVSDYFLRSKFFASDGQSIRASVPGASTGVPTHDKGHAERPDMQRRVRTRGAPPDLPEHLPQNQNLSVSLFYDFHQLLWH